MSTYTLRENPYLDEVMFSSFMDELGKIAADLGLDVPLVKMASDDPEAFVELLKEAGIFGNIGARLGQYAGRAKDRIKNLWSRTPGAARSVVHEERGLDPASWGLPAEPHRPPVTSPPLYFPPVPTKPNPHAFHHPDLTIPAPPPVPNPLEPPLPIIPRNPKGLHPAEFGLVVPPDWGRKRPLPDNGLARRRRGLGPSNLPDIFRQAQDSYSYLY